MLHVLPDIRAECLETRRLFSRLSANYPDCLGANATGVKGVNRLIKWLETSL